MGGGHGTTSGRLLTAAVPATISPHSHKFSCLFHTSFQVESFFISNISLKCPGYYFIWLMLMFSLIWSILSKYTPDNFAYSIHVHTVYTPIFMLTNNYNQAVCQRWARHANPYIQTTFLSSSIPFWTMVFLVCNSAISSNTCAMLIWCARNCVS